MKILICSDITFDPIKKEIQKTANNLVIDLEYHEDLISPLANREKNYKNYDFVLFYTDQIFHQKSNLWQNQFLLQMVVLANENPNKRFIISNCLTSAYTQKGMSLKFSAEQEVVDLYSQALTQISSLDNLFFLDVKQLIFNEGQASLYNFALGALYQMPYTKKMISLLASEILELTQFLSEEEKKVIVVDCDNTLWKGIIGEDGIDGIHCDKNAEGFVHFQFQSFLKQKKEEGFLLCICSKNNENEVKEAFSRKNMPLKWDDFLIKKINWSPKNINLIAIANELNLGGDSFIFIDDNPFEIGTVKEFTNVKTTILFENDYNKLLKLTRY